MSSLAVNPSGRLVGSWSSQGAEGAEGLTALFGKRCLGEFEVEYALRDIAYFLGGFQGVPSWLTWLPHALPLCEIAAAMERDPGDPAFSVCEFAEEEEFGTVEVRRSADPLRAAVLFAVWSLKSGLRGKIIKRRGAVYVENSPAITGAPCVVKFIEDPVRPYWWREVEEGSNGR